MTVIETSPLLDTMEETDTRCEDCPKINDNPPDRSECLYFEAGNPPDCSKGGASDELIQRFLGSTSNMLSEVNVEIRGSNGG